MKQNRSVISILLLLVSFQSLLWHKIIQLQIHYQRFTSPSSIKYDNILHIGHVICVRYDFTSLNVNFITI